MQDKIEKLREKALKLIEEAKSSEELERARVSLLGKKGEITGLIRSIGKLPPEERPLAGKLLNALKREVEERIEEKRKTLPKVRKVKIDTSIPGRRPKTGALHPLTRIEEEIVDIFMRMGFSVEYGPEIETDYYNFTALNTPEHHPARDLHDTFYLEDGNLLRTHTSPVQIRVMEKKKPPLRIISPGRAYRFDPFDPSHSPVFHQVEGLWVDRDVSFSDLKGTLEAFGKELFGKETRIKLVPHYFPFTEPSAEVHLSCPFCKEKGCRVCKYTGWVEIAGCGMVHPEVLRGVGIDPYQWTGFAFGMGVERIAMLRYGIDDIRNFYENDLRFIEGLR